MKTLKILVTAAILASGLSGCRGGPKQEAGAPVDPKREGPAGVSVTPMTRAPIAIAPVAGSESVQGGGSGVGQAMKGRAKQLASGHHSTVNQPPVEEDRGDGN